jgi:hypothetical protein
MAAKLGQAIYWGCRVIAAMLIAFPILAMSYNWIEGAPLQPHYVMLGFFALRSCWHRDLADRPSGQVHSRRALANETRSGLVAGRDRRLDGPPRGTDLGGKRLAIVLGFVPL